MKLYNTLTRKKEALKPLKKGVISIYNCGPTVYDYPTIGNLRTYINVDLLRRGLEFEGLKANEVMNITDIEDKIIRDSKKLRVPYGELTRKYEKAFLAEIHRLNIEPVEKMPRATDEIPCMIKIIEKLLTSGYAYKSDDGSVYFSVKKFRNYGKLSRLDKSGIRAGARVAQDEYDKDSAQDFALWKAKVKGEPSWPAPFGEGRPGWHIECSAMSTKYLGDTIDIHAGGVDLVFPHHENEIAQSEAATGRTFVNMWFHGEHLLINGKRMGKSQGNAYTLEDLGQKFQVEPLAFRMLCLTAHYRDKLNFTEASIADAQNTLNNLRSFLLRLGTVSNQGKGNRLSGKITSASHDFGRWVADDISIPRALAVIFDLIKEANRIKDINQTEARGIGTALIEFDKVLGLGLSDIEVRDIPDKVHELAVQREDARKAGEYDKADTYRKKLDKLGYSVEDTPDGPILRQK
jgi:cysteinyl-tRNA synthetase